MHILLKRKCWILYFNGHVTYVFPMTPKLILSSKLHYWISKPKFRAKQHISRIAGTVLIADYFLGAHFGTGQISVEQSLTDTFIRLLRIYPLSSTCSVEHSYMIFYDSVHRC